jgi:hypothetical protein
MFTGFVVGSSFVGMSKSRQDHKALEAGLWAEG